MDKKYLLSCRWSSTCPKTGNFYRLTHSPHKLLQKKKGTSTMEHEKRRVCLNVYQGYGTKKNMKYSLTTQMVTQNTQTKMAS